LEEGKELQPEAVGMSNEEILDVFYDKISYNAAKDAWQTAFDAELLCAAEADPRSCRCQDRRCVA
jgi:hypothetical protein